MDEPEPTVESMIADGFGLVAAAMIRQATALEGVADQLEALAAAMNEVIATLNSGIDVTPTTSGIGELLPSDFPLVVIVPSTVSATELADTITQAFERRGAQ